MGNILSQLAFESYLFFFLGDVVDGNLKAGILEDDTFYNEYAPVFIDVDGETLLFFIRRSSLCLTDKIGDFLKFVNGKYLLGSLQVGIGD